MGGDKTGHELETAENLKCFDDDFAAIHGATQEADDYVTFWLNQTLEAVLCKTFPCLIINLYIPYRNSVKVDLSRTDVHSKGNLIDATIHVSIHGNTKNDVKN